jgi:hypothetical protein
MIISTPIFEAYLKCPSKCWFLFLDKKGDANIYSDFLGKRNNAYRAAGIERLMAKIQPGECVVKPSIPLNIKTARWLLAIDLVARKETFESCLHAVERIPTDGRGNPDYLFAHLLRNLESACIKARRYKLAPKKIVPILKNQNFESTACEIKLTRPSSHPSLRRSVVARRNAFLLAPCSVEDEIVAAYAAFARTLHGRP